MLELLFGFARVLIRKYLNILHNGGPGIYVVIFVLVYHFTQIKLWFTTLHIVIFNIFITIDNELV